VQTVPRLHAHGATAPVVGGELLVGLRPRGGSSRAKRSPWRRGRPRSPGALGAGSRYHDDDGCSVLRARLPLSREGVVRKALKIVITAGKGGSAEPFSPSPRWLPPPRSERGATDQAPDRPQHCLYFLPLPHGHGWFRPTFGVERSGRTVAPGPRPDRHHRPQRPPRAGEVDDQASADRPGRRTGEQKAERVGGNQRGGHGASGPAQLDLEDRPERRCLRNQRDIGFLQAP
jgi:hypothetical protein